MRIGYLSAAPRVSTHADAESMAPRTHVLGVIGGFESLGWNVRRFIVGDRMPRRVRTGGETLVTSARWQTLAADLGRMGMGSFYARRAWRELGRDVDIVYERLGAFQSLGWIFRAHGTPWVVETSSPYYIESLADRKSVLLAGVLRRREIAIYQDCDLVVCVSEELKKLIVAAAAIPTEKVVVMPNAVDLERFNPHQPTPKRMFSGLTVGFVGYLIKWQGVDLLLEAVAALQFRGIDLYTVIVGDGPERRALESLARSLGISNRVRFTGQVPGDEAPAYIAGFDLGFSGQRRLSAGRMYNSPLKLYEYMAMGKPVVASAFADAWSLVEGKGTGFLFAPEDQEDLNSVLTEAVQRWNSLPAMGAAARALIAANHSWTARLSQLTPHLLRLTGGA